VISYPQTANTIDNSDINSLSVANMPEKRKYIQKQIAVASFQKLIVSLSTIRSQTGYYRQEELPHRKNI